MKLPRLLYEDLVRRALLEDLGRVGDLTSDSIIPLEARVRGNLISREPGCVAGMFVSTLAFSIMDPDVRIEYHVQDGDRIEPGQALATVDGEARSLLSAERSALNFLALLSGIATATRGIVDRLRGYDTKIVCTRKTTPGLRTLEKYAVRAGGGFNHRFGLDDAVLIKDNHLAVAGSIEEAVRRVRYCVGHTVKVEIEVDTLEQLEIALGQPIDAVLLDNMTIDQVKAAVKMVRRRLVTEVSGGITPETAIAYGAAGVDLISVGWLTHSAPALDVSLDVESLSSVGSAARAAVSVAQTLR
ncbi:MAG: carboxylating nicotinate-nucleotide diphosphorylase [Acidobacteriota bacterium]|jgi:nicotinate-nucleotide pyrophosphorylase (carboxylating)